MTEKECREWAYENGLREKYRGLVDSIRLYVSEDDIDFSKLRETLSILLEPVNPDETL